MASIVKYDPNTKYFLLPDIENVDGSSYQGQSNLVIYSSDSQILGWRSLRDSVPAQYLIYDAGLTAMREMTSQEKATVDAAAATALLNDERNSAQAVIDSTDSDGKSKRAIVILTVDQLNSIFEWITSFKAAVAAATSLSNLQTRVAALPNMPDITYTQARTAIKSKIADGTADS